MVESVATSDADGARRALQLVDVREAAAICRVSTAYLWRQIWAGHLPAVRLGRATRVRLTDLETYITARTSGRRAAGV